MTNGLTVLNDKATRLRLIVAAVKEALAGGAPQVRRAG